MVNDFISGSTIDSGTDYLKYKLLGKILGVNNNQQNVPDQDQQDDNDDNAQQQIQQNQQNQDALKLQVNGSAAANTIENKTKVVIDNAKLNFKDNDDALFNASAINSAHHLSFAGAAGIMAQGGNGNKASVGVDGAVAVNNIDNTTETLINKSEISYANQVNALAINGGESIAAGLGLQVIASSQHSQSTGSGAINGSVNLIDNTVTSKVNNTNLSSDKSENITNMAVTAYEADTQVTGGISAAVGKQKGGVGVSVDIAKITNNLTAEINGGKMTQMKNVEVNALQASTIVNAGIALAVSAGVDQGSFGFSGAGVYSELNNTNNANIKNATIIGEAVSVRAQDVRRNDPGILTYEDNLIRNGKNLDFIEKEGKEFYTGLDTATGTTEIGELVTSRKGSLIFSGAISGAYGGTAVGLGIAINEVDNTFNVNVDNANITTNKFDANAISYTKAITLGIGASISTEANKGSGVGSAAWNDIKNKANVKFFNNTIKADNLELKSSNASSLIGIGGQFSVSKGYAAVGASVAYNDIENTANSEIYGGSVTGIATNTSKLSVNSENTSDIWGISVSVEAADKLAVGGTVSINKIDNNATSKVGWATSTTNITSIKEFNILATDSADIKGLSGAITASKKVSIGGAVTVNHISGETAAKLNRANFNASNTNIKAYSESNNLSLALGCGGAGTFAFDGAAVNNDIFRDVYVKVDKSTTNNATGTFDSSAIAIGNTGSLAAVVLGAGKVSIGAGVSVNRMGGKVQTTFDGNNFKLKNLSATSYSNQDITTIGIAGSGAGVSISGSIAYNAIEYNTVAEVLNSTLISATNNIAVKALSDDTIKNYAGVLSLGIGIPTEAAGAGGIGGGAVPGVGAGAADNRNKFLKIFDTISGGLKSGHDKMGTLSNKMGGVGVGVSVSVNKIDSKTNARVSGGNVSAQGKDSKDKVKIKSKVDDSDINNTYMDSSTIDIKGSLADKRKEVTKTGLVIDSSSTHTTKSFLASVSGGGKAGANANVNVNYVGGETNSSFENATVNKGLTGKTAGDVNVNASDYTNTAGFIGNVSFGGTAGIGLSADANKVVRETNAKVRGIKDGSVANNLEVKALSKQGISSVVAGLAASLKVGVAGNVDVALLNSTTKALVENSKISVNSLDVEANHYARAHELAVAAGIGAGTAGVGAAVVVNNDINTVYAGVASSTINANSGSNGAFKVNSKNDDDFETITGAGGVGMYAGVAGAVAVDYMENNVETNVASSTFGNTTNRAGSIEIKSKDVSKQVSKGGSVGIGGYAGVGAVVEVNTLDGQTNTNITNSKIFATNDIDLGASERRDSEQFAVSVSAGLAGVGANVLVINSGKKLDVKDSGSNDANKDINSAMDMADTAASSDYLGDNYYTGAFTTDEINTIFKGTPSYTASKDGKAVTLTKIDKSTIDSKSGKISSLSTADGTLTLSNNGAAAGAGGVMGTFGYIYDNKNVVTTITNSNINAKNGIDYKSETKGKSDLSMFQGSAGLGDYSGAFAYINISGKNSVGVAGSTITNASGAINLQSLDYASGKAEASGYMVGGAAVGTIISRVKNNSSTDVTIGKSKITSSTASGSINILSEKSNSLEAIGNAGGAGILGVTVISTLAQDDGSSNVKLDTGNTFKANELTADANNNPVLKSSYSARSGAGLGVGVGDVTTREYGRSTLIAQSGSKYDVSIANLGASMSSTSKEESSAHTYGLVDIKTNRVDSLSASNVDVIVNIGKNNYNNNTILNVSANNKDSTTMAVDGQSGGAVSIANSLASATANLTTNVTITGAGDSTKLGELNAASSSEAEHRLYANGDGGGLINVSPYAAEVDSTMNLTTNTKLAGTLSATKTKADAVGRGKSYTTTHAYQGSVTGGSGVQTNTNIIANTKVLANENLKLTGDSIKLATLNDFTTGPEREDKNNNGRAYGGITGNSVIGREKITGTSEVNIGKKASLIADKELKIDAKTKTDLKNKVYSGGAGLGIHIGSEGDYNLTLNNNIITNAGSLLKTEDEDADIYLATSYDFNAYYLTLSEVFGSGGGSTKAHTKYNITTNNKIDLTGDVYSYHDINLLTDRSTDNVKSKYNLSTEAECYTKSVIAWETDPVLEGSLKLNNNINVNSSSTVQSVRHSRFYVDNGDFSYKTHTKRYTWYNDEDKDTKNNSFATVAEGVKNGDVKQNTAIKVDGKVITGVHKDINIKIDGKVSFDKTVSGSGFVNTPTIECSVDEYKNAIKYGTMEYGNKLFERYQELEKLCVEYSGTIVGQNYEAEKIRLQNEMEKYGLYDAKNNSAVGKLSVDYIELPDMISSGGNIYIKGTEAKNINGKGTLKAQGAPKITVENNSNLYMIVNDLKILDPGGDIILNDLELQTKAKETIKGVTNVETDASTGSSIDVKENWESSYDISYKDPDGKQGKITGYTPLTNIEINGDIVNVYGKVNFFNKNKDIVLQGKTAKDSASINGREISISAPKGSIAQGYTQGITNIGYTPEFVLKKFAKANEDAISKGVTSDTTKTDSITLTEADIQKYIDEYKKTPEGINESASGVWLAGGSIFLNGDDINVNGTIQSGYSQFEVTLTNSNKSRINTIKSQYQKDHKPEVTDSYLSEYCKINTSGMMWDNNEKAYKYVVQAYYNPQTDQIILEDVKSEGGKIYLTGRISNTSGGKIFAADGSSDINITNKTGINLVAKTLDAGDRKGLISITDLGKNKDDKGNKILGTLTEITSDSTKVWYLTSKGKNVNPDKTSGSISSYTPSLGLTYNWSTGYDTLDEFRYDTSYKFLFWGLIDYGEETKATLEYKKEHNEITPKHLDNKSKLAGTFIGTPDGVDSKKGYFVYFNKDGKYKNGPITGGYTDYNTFFHASGTQYQWAIMKEGSTEIYQHSIKADYPIAIKFLTGKGLINVDTNSNLTLSSDITSKNGKVNLISKCGSIEQLGGTITTDKLTMEASTGIGANKAITQQMNSKDGVLSATTNSGDINLISLNQAGLKDAALKFTATTNKGNVNVVADASLLKGNNALDVKGSRIDLVSNYGSLGDGAHNEYLNIYAGQVLAKPGDTLSASVNASALGDIALNQDSGNMRIGKIVSKTGDVYLTTSGSILDALPPSGKEVMSESAEKLIEKWKQLGIISEDGTDNSAEKKQEAIDQYKKGVEVSFKRYLDLKKEFEKNNDTNSVFYSEYQSLKEKFGNYATSDKWLEAQSKDENSDWYLLQNKTYYGWDVDSLLYAIQDSIINREEGSTVTPKAAEDANIKARNVYIKAGGGIGRDEGYTVLDISNLQSKEGIEVLKQIAAAEASDVKWGYAGDKVDKNKATINNINSIAIDAKGTLEAYAKGNIYFEDVNNNQINLISVASEDGNVRVYGSNGVYNATNYVEGNKNNTINLAGKDLILEGGNGSIGSSTVPVTTNMSGFVTVRSEGLINLYQIGGYALTFAAAYSGADMNIRSIGDILSVYNGKQADELGYINAKGSITLLSDKGNIGQANGKGLRVKLAEGQLLNAEADSIYIKGQGDNKNINLGQFKARKGDIGIESKLWDVFLKNNISANNIELIVRSLTQLSGKLTVNNLLKVISDNGIMLSNAKNHIPEAYIVNNKSGVVGLNTDTDLTLHKAINLAVDSAMTIFANGSINSLDVIESFGSLFIWSKGNINSSNDLMAKDWMGLYAENGGINVKGGLTANAIDLSVDENGLTADGIYSDSYIKANVELGDIIINGNVKATEGSIDLVTEFGDVKFDNVEAKDDIKVAAYFGKEFTFKTINSKEGSVEAVSFGSLTGDSINAGKDFYVASILDLNLNKLVGGPSDSDTLSYLFGKNVKIDSITVDNKFEAISEKLDVNDIKITGNTKIDSYYDININKINVDGDLCIDSIGDYEFGDINIKEINNSNGNLSLSNEIGDINLNTVNADGDVFLSNYDKGNIYIEDNIITRLGGSLYAYLENGDFIVNSGDINGEASIYSEEGDIILTDINVKDELDIRAKDGSIGIAFNTFVGGDATLKSDTEGVMLFNADVAGNLKISAKQQAVITDANVGGSMLMKGDEEGCVANTLNVGKDLIVNTQTGFIDIEDANVGEDSYISIESKDGGNIEIEKIRTGTGSIGDLIIESKSLKTDGAGLTSINIKDAVAANKIIINSTSNVSLNSAYALNGKLEVKAAGNVVAELIKAAKETYLSTLVGIIDITKVISGDSIFIGSFGGGLEIDDIVTLNPEANIELVQWFGNINISNASTTKDLCFSTLEGDIHLDKVSSGNDITIEGGLFGDTNINIENSYAGNDIKINGGDGKIDITNTNIGNNLSIHLRGDMEVNNVNVGNITKIIGKEESLANINKLKSNSLIFNDDSKTSLNLTNSNIGDANIELKGDAKLEDSSIGSIDAKVGSDLTVNNLSSIQMSSVVDGNATIDKLTGNKFTELTVGKDLKLTNSSINNLTTSAKGNTTISKLTNNSSSSLTVGKDATITDSSIGNLTATIGGTATIDKLVNNQVASVTVGGDANITNSKIDTLTAKVTGNTSIDNLTNKQTTANISGNANISNMTSDELTATIGGSTQVTDSTIGNIKANINGNLTANNLLNTSSNIVVGGTASIASMTSSDVTATIGSNTNITDSAMGNLTAQVRGDLTVNQLVNSRSSIVVKGNTDIVNLTSDDVTAQIVGIANLTDSKVGKLNAEVKGDTTIKNVENSELAATVDGKAEISNLIGNKTAKLTVGKDATITDSNIAKLNAEVKGDTTITDLVNSELIANISGKAEIEKLTGNKTANLNIKKDASFTDSSIGNLTASIGGNGTINKLTGNNSSQLTVGKDAIITDSQIGNLNANIGGNADIRELTSDNVTAQIGGIASFTDSKIAVLNSQIKGDTLIKNLTNNELTADIDGKAEIVKLTVNKSAKLTIGKDASIKDSSIAKLDANIKGDTLIKNLTNTELTADIGGKVEIEKLTGNKSAKLTIGKDASIKDSSIQKLDANIKGDTAIKNVKNTELTADIGGKVEIEKLSGNRNAKLTVGQDASVVDSRIGSLKASVKGNVDINKLTGNRSAELTIGKDAVITDSSIDILNASINGKTDINKLTSKSSKLNVGKDVVIKDSKVDKLNAEVKGNININNLENIELSAVIGGNAEIASLTSSNMTAKVGGYADISDSKIGVFNAEINGDANINSLVNSNFVAIIGGNTTINKITGTKAAELTVRKDATILESQIDKLKASIDGNASINNLTNKSSQLSIGKNASIEESSIDDLKASVNGKADINKLTNISSDLTVGSDATITNSQIGKLNAKIGGNTKIDNLANNELAAVIDGNAEIASLTSSNMTAKVGGYANITDSKIAALNAEVIGDTSINNLVNSQLTANVGGNVTIDNLTGNKSANLTVGKDAKITNSSINTLIVNAGGNATIDKLTENKSANLTAGKDANITNSSINALTATIKGNATIDKLTDNNSTNLTVGNDATITNSSINTLIATVKGNATIDKLTDNNSSKLTLTKDGKITNSNIASLEASIGGNANISSIVNSQLAANIGGNATINNLTGNKSAQLSIGNDAFITESSIDVLKASINGKADINKLTNKSSDLTVGKDAAITSSQMSKVNAKVGGNAKISELTSDNVTTQIGGNASLTDSKVGILNSKITGDTTINNVENTELTADIGGKVEIEKLTGNKSAKLTVGKDATIKDSSMAKVEAKVTGNTTINNLSNNQLTANIGGKATISNLKGNESTSLTVGKDASITNSQMGNLNAQIGGNTTIENLANNQLTANVGGNATINKVTGNKSTNLTAGKDATITNSSINTLTATAKGNATIDKLSDNNSSMLTLTKDGKITNSNIGKLEASIGGNANINNIVNSQLTANVGGNATINKVTGNKSTNLTAGKDATITNSSINTLTATAKGNATIDKLSDNNSSKLTLTKDGKITNSNIGKLEASIGGNANINNIVNSQLTANVGGNATINKVTGNKSTNLNAGKDATITNSSINTLTATAKGNATIDKLTNKNSSDLTVGKNLVITNSDINKLNAIIGGNSTINKSTFDQINTKVTGNASIATSTVDTMTAVVDGTMSITETPIKLLDLNTKKGAIITRSNIDEMKAVIDGNSSITNSVFKKVNLTNKGKAVINKTTLNNINTTNSGNLSISDSTANSFALTNSGDTVISKSKVNALTGNNSGSLTVKNTPVNTIDVTTSGKLTFDKVDTSKLKMNNSGTASIKNVSVNGAGYITNNKGNVNIESFNVSKNFDMDSKSGNIYMNNIDINKDFNFALSGDSKVSFGEIVIGENFNIYAGKASIKGTGLWVGENMNTYTYSKYSAPKLSLRAVVSANASKNIRTNTDEGFILVLDELNIGGGLYVDNPDVTIKVKDSYVGHDVNIDAGKENIQIDNLDVDGGSLDIKGSSGSIKLGTVTVDNKTNINLGSGNLDVNNLTSKLDIDFNVGGNIISKDKVKSDNSTINVVSGGNLTAKSVEAKGKIDFNAGGNITSDNKIETQTQSVNMVAGGSVDAYKVLAKQQGNIEAVNGDIIIGQIDGKTLVFKEDTNNRTLRIGKANVETKITAGADYIDIDLIKQDNSNDRLDIDFSLINGHAMDNVVIRDIQTKNGVEMFNLVSTYGNIHVSHEIFNLTRTYLLKKGDLSNTILKFRLYGDNPIYSRDADIIAFFSPMRNHKSFADISFTNEWHPEKQDYYPLTAKGDYRRMFNQYTVVQDFETLRLAYEERIKDFNDDSNGKFDYRNLTNSKYFYVDNTPELSSDGESVNLDDIDIPVGLEFDSASGELKAVGSHIKPQAAVD